MHTRCERSHRTSMKGLDDTDELDTRRGRIYVGKGLRPHRLHAHDPASSHAMPGTLAQYAAGNSLHCGTLRCRSSIPDHAHRTRYAAKRHARARDHRACFPQKA